MWGVHCSRIPGTVLRVLVVCLMPAWAGQKLVNAPSRILTAENAGKGLFLGMHHLFTIPGYWDYGNFHPQKCAELPGKLFRAKAQGEECREVYVESGNDKFYPGLGTYTLNTGRLFAAWRVKAPLESHPGGRVSYVHPAMGPWEIWLEKAGDGVPVWHVRTLYSGSHIEKTISRPPLPDGWYEVRLTLQPESLEFELNHEPAGHFPHDGYPENFRMHFGSLQPDPGGPAVVSEFRYVFFDRFRYPDSARDAAPEGPEDIRPEDKLLYGVACKATPESPRHSEGDMIRLKDGRLLLVWSDYFKGLGWDGSPARLSAKTSSDGARTWSKPRVVVDYDPKSPGGNVMSVSLIRAKGGDLLMAYVDRTPDMKAKGLVLRRSTDEGLTWSARTVITPDTGNVHIANNAGLRMLRNGRIVLACREYIRNIRWPYALYSDDDGHTWKAGQHVPAPDLTPSQIKAQNVNEPNIAELADGRLIMMMRSMAGGHFFSYSSDSGETWTKPYLSPLRGTVAPPYIGSIPATGDLLAVWTEGLTGRTPLNSAVSKDGGKTWSPVKLLDQSEHYGYGYTSVVFVNGRAYITTMRYPLFASLERFQVQPGYIDLLLISLPVEWFYRMPH